jgi:YVTN family beta-propeller protein
MKIANFLLPKSTSGSHVTNEDQIDPDVTAVGGVAVRRGPIGDIASADATVVVTNYGDDSVTFLNPATLAVERNVAVEGEPFAAVVSRDRAYISTSSENFDGVAVIDLDTKTVVATYPLAFSVAAMAISPDGKRVYAGRTGHDRVDIAVIDTTAERVGTIDIATGAGIGIDAIAVDSTGKRLYVGTTDVLGSQLVVVDAETARVDRTLPVGAPIRDVALADGTAYVLTSDRVRGGAVSVIDLSTNRIIDTVDLGVGAPTQMALSPDKTRAYIVDYDHVAVLCTLSREVLNTVTVDARPSSVTLDFRGDRLYVADYAGEVTAFSVDSSTPLLYSQFMATDPIALPEPRALEPATV